MSDPSDATPARVLAQYGALGAIALVFLTIVTWGSHAVISRILVHFDRIEAQSDRNTEIWANTARALERLASDRSADRETLVSEVDRCCPKRR